MAIKNMDLDLLSNILRELILIHNRVSLPSMGSFIAEKAPSVFSDRAMVIHPPFRRILFRPSEIWNDGLLETAYSKEKGCELEVAIDEIAQFVKALKVNLNTNKSFRIPNFGTMRATEQNDYFFVADNDLFNCLEIFGLEPVNVKILPRRGEIESLDGKPLTDFFKKDIRSMPSSTNSIIEEVVQEQEPVIAKLKDPIKSSNSSRFIKRVLITLLVIFSIILIMVLLVIFKEELNPFWEWILYNKEERELIRSSLSLL